LVFFAWEIFQQVVKVPIWPTGFLWFWCLCNVWKGILRKKKLDSDILMPWNLALKFPLQPRPMKLTVSQCKQRVWVSEWVVTSSQELPNPASSGHCCFSSGEEFSSTKKKQTEVGETMRLSGKQNKSMKL